MAKVNISVNSNKYFIALGVSLALIIIVLVLIKFIRNAVRRKNIEKQLSQYNEFKLIKAHNKGYDYVLRSEDKDIYIKIAYTMKHSQICINSKETWKLSYSFFKKEYGLSYQSSRYMDELVNFLDNDIQTNRKYLKLIYLYKGVESIIRYLNESELDVVDIEKSPYGYKITSYNTFDKDINIIKNF